MDTENDMKKILCLVLSVEQPSTKYRVYQYTDFFRSRGIRLVPHEIAGKRFKKKLKLIRLAKEFDAVLLQKKLLSPELLRYLKYQNPNVCYDFDDALYARESFAVKRAGYYPGSFLVRWKLNGTLKNVPCVVAGNRTLADYAVRLNPRVFVVPTPVDINRYSFVHRKRERDFRIGWIGTSSNQFYLNRIIPEVIQFLNAFPDAYFHYMSNKDILDISHNKVYFHVWSEGREIDFFQKLSVGLMPLRDDDWSRGKCAFKALQYMSTGLPAIVSNVGMNADLIRHGENGFLVSADGEWYKYLEWFHDNSDLLLKIGQEARVTVENDYSVEHCGNRLLDSLMKVFGNSWERMKN
jgi:glycosyltransferase involved in cell wall biosynthesis